MPVAQDWLRPNSPFRKVALERGSDGDRLLAPHLGPRAGRLLQTVDSGSSSTRCSNKTMGHARRLDEMVSGEAEEKPHGAPQLPPPRNCSCISLPATCPVLPFRLWFWACWCARRSSKMRSGTSLLPRLLAHSIYEVEPKLGACLEVAEWRGGNAVLEEALFAEADCVTATGSDETLAAIRERRPPDSASWGYGHRVSFAYVTAAVLTGSNARKSPPRPPPT